MKYFGDMEIETDINTTILMYKKYIINQKANINISELFYGSFINETVIDIKYALKEHKTFYVQNRIAILMLLSDINKFIENADINESEREQYMVCYGDFHLDYVKLFEHILKCEIDNIADMCNNKIMTSKSEIVKYISYFIEIYQKLIESHKNVDSQYTFGKVIHPLISNKIKIYGYENVLGKIIDM